jgi:hypothetical protein
MYKTFIPMPGPAFRVLLVGKRSLPGYQDEGASSLSSVSRSSRKEEALFWMLASIKPPFAEYC